MPFLSEIIELSVRGDGRIHSVTPAANRAGNMAVKGSGTMNTKAIIAVTLAAALAGFALSGPAAAHGYGYGRGGGHVTFGLHFGVPLGYYGYYPAPYYYYPPYYPPAVVAPGPTTYVERGDAAPSPDAQAYWYYCPDSRGYYPYVKQCPGGWQKVAPQPQQ
jgi:hypothetical protein